MVEYGSGPSLDRYLDFQVGSTGDIGSSFGSDELQKDLGVFVKAGLEYGYGIDSPESIAANGVLGEQFDPGVLRDVEMAVTKIVGRDPRIEYIVDVSARRGSRTDELIVRCEAAVEDDVEDLEFIISK